MLPRLAADETVLEKRVKLAECLQEVVHIPGGHITLRNCVPVTWSATYR